MARVTPTAVRLLRSDPFAALVQALETFDETTQTAAPAGILTERVVVPRAPRLGADTPQDALAICLDTHGRVDLGEIARLLGIAPAGGPGAARRSSSTRTRPSSGWCPRPSTCPGTSAPSSTTPATPRASGRSSR